MVINSLEIGKMEKYVGKEHFNILTVEFIKEIGKMINLKEMVLSHVLKEINT